MTLISKKTDLCAGVECNTCWQRHHCSDFVFTAPPLHPPKNPHRKKRAGGPIQKSKMYFGLAERFGYKCRICGASELEVENRGETLEIHHLRERANGGQNHISNCWLVCTSCHIAIGHHWTKKRKGKK